MYSRFKEWQRASGATREWTQKAMTTALKERGFIQIKKTCLCENKINLRSTNIGKQWF